MATHTGHDEQPEQPEIVQILRVTDIWYVFLRVAGRETYWCIEAHCAPDELAAYSVFIQEWDNPKQAAYKKQVLKRNANAVIKLWAQVRARQT